MTTKRSKAVWTEEQWIAYIKNFGFIKELIECSERKLPSMIKQTRDARGTEEYEGLREQLKAQMDMLRLRRKALNECEA